MRAVRLLSFSALPLLLACQPGPPSRVIVIDGERAQFLAAGGSPTIHSVLAQAGLVLEAGDSILLQGYPANLQQSLTANETPTIQIRRAVSLMLNGKVIRASRPTVGQTLAAAGYSPFAADRFDPPPGTAVSDGLTVSYTPSREFHIDVGSETFPVRSARETVATLTAQAGLPLLGLDVSSPSEDRPPPDDARIRIVRVSETLVLAPKPIPFQTLFEASNEVELDHDQVLQSGGPGLAISRTRIRYEDSQETSRQTDSQALVTPPRDRIVGYGTKVVIRMDTVDGAQIRYWRAVSMFATAYSPCNSAADRCYPGTASGVPVQKGVVAVKYAWYLSMRGQAIYVPGYGYATIEDVCGGCLGKAWIDLGYSDGQYSQEGAQWGKYVTVYFLAPAPPNIEYVLQ